MPDQADREAREGTMLRFVGAVLLLAMMVVHQQDAFGRFTAAFTAVFAVLWVGALALVIAGGRIGAVMAAGAGVEWASRIGGGLACLGLLVLHFVPGWHTAPRLAAASGAATILACAILVAGGRAARAAAPVMAAALLILLTTPQPYQGTSFFWPRDAHFQVTSVLTFLFLAAASFLRLRASGVLVGSIIAGILLRLHGIDHHEINAVHRDMLPLVQYACEAFLDGRNPYAILFYANHDLPLTYLPVMWLTYLPAIVVGADIRWTSIIATVVIAVVIMRWARRRGGEEPEPGLAAVSVAFLFQPEVFWNSVHGEPIVYWLWLVVFLDAVLAGRAWRAALLLGLLLGTRHFSILLVPFATLWFLTRPSGWRAGLPKLLSAGVLACLIVVPFFRGHPDSFLYGVYDWLVAYGPSRRSWWDVQIGFQQFFYHAGRESMLPVIQAAVMSAAACVSAAFSIRALVRRHAVHDLPLWLPLVVGYTLFILFNSMIWKSFLFPVLILVVFAAAVGKGAPATHPPTPSSREVPALAPRFYYPVVAIMLAGLAWSAYTLALGFKRHRDLSDIQLAARYVAARVLTKGDLLVDWSRPQAGHVNVPSLFQGIELPPGVRPVRRMRAEDLTAYDRIVLFDGFSRFDPRRDFPDLVRVTSRKMGRSSLHVLRPAHRMDARAFRLSSSPGAVEGAVLVSGRPPSVKGRREGTRWDFPGRPGWNHVGPAVLHVVGRPLKCIWAHPADGFTLRITIDVPRAGPAVLVTALDDRAIRPLLSPVVVRVPGHGPGPEGAVIRSPNETGRWFWDLGEIGAGQLVLEVSAERAAMRHFGFDLLVAGDGD